MFNRLFQRTTRRPLRKTPSHRQFRHGVEPLESRAMLAVVPNLTGTYLGIEVNDNDTDTTAYVRLNAGNIEVSSDVNYLVVNKFSASSVSGITINGTGLGLTVNLTDGTINTDFTATNVQTIKFDNSSNIASDIDITLDTGRGDLLLNGVNSGTEVLATVLAGEIKIENGLSATNSITIIAAGSITQDPSSFIQTISLEATTSVGKIELDSTANSVEIFNATNTDAGGVINFANGSAVTINNVATFNGEITLNAAEHTLNGGIDSGSGAITIVSTSGIQQNLQSSVITTGVFDAVSAGNIEMNSLLNNVGTLSATNNGPTGIISFTAISLNVGNILTDDGLITLTSLSTISITGLISNGIISSGVSSVILAASGDITQDPSGKIESDILNATTSAGSITLDSIDNAVKTFSGENTAQSGTITFINDSGFISDAVTTLNGDIYLQSLNATLDIRGEITSGTGGVTLIADGDLTTSNKVTSQNGNIHLESVNAKLYLGSEITSGTGGVTLIANGGIEQTTVSTITAKTLEAYESNGNIGILSLKNLIDSFSASNTYAGGSVALGNGKDVSLNNIETDNGDITVTADGVIVVGGILDYGTGILKLVSTTAAPVDFRVMNNLDDFGGLTFRRRLFLASANTPLSQLVMVSFDSSVSTISLASTLDSITRPMTINGKTSDGNIVNLTGTSAGPTTDGLTFDTGSEASKVLDLKITNFSSAGLALKSSNIEVQDSVFESNNTGITISGNITGVLLKNNSVLINTTHGIVVTDNASATLNSNTISGNLQSGIYVDSVSPGVLISGNKIGLLSDGITAQANGNDGIQLTGTSGVQIETNTISSNAGSGIQITKSAGTEIKNNIIGLDYVTNTTDLGNTLDGITVNDSSITITSNTVAGNNRDGIRIEGDSAGSTISGNLIGVQASGIVVGNTFAGIRVLSLVNGINQGVTIGTVPEPNIIGGNLDGIVIQESFACEITGNYVGIGIFGVDPLGIPNTNDGIRVESSNDTLVSNNWTSSNESSGIHIIEGSNSSLVGNHVGYGVLGNLETAFGNVLYGIHVEGGLAHVIGGGSSADANVVSGNNSDGIKIVGSEDVQIVGNFLGTDSTGNLALANGGNGLSFENTKDSLIHSNLSSGNVGSGISIVATSPELASGNKITANYVGVSKSGLNSIANGQSGIAVFGASGTIIGVGETSLRNIISGNSGSGIVLTGAVGTEISGNYIGVNSNGLQKLGNLGNGVEVLVGSIGTTIDGINLIAYNGTAGSAILGHGILVADSSATIGNTATGRSSGNLVYRNFLDGIRITGTGATNVAVVGNFIGTNAAGVLGLGNGGSGISIDSANGVEVGGNLPSRPTDSILGNLIVGNTIGIQITNAVASDLSLGNRVTGNVVERNKGIGILVDKSVFQSIGGSLLETANSFVRNGSDGIRISNRENSGTAGYGYNSVKGNYIGTDVAGSLGLGNIGDGIALVDSAGNTIGGNDSESGNIVSRNRSGIRLSNAVAATLATGNQIIGNTLQSNKVDGIRLESSDLNQVGTIGSGNFVWSNTGVGINILGGSDSNVIAGNQIGTNDAFASLGNTTGGVVITASTLNSVQGNLIGKNGDSGITIIRGSANIIGGSTSGLGNLVQNNRANGISLLLGTSGNSIQGNTVESNARAGISLNSATSNIINSRNIITQNATSGILVSLASNKNTITDNLIGTNEFSTTGLGNLGAGITILGSSSNTIGTVGSGNVITGNAGDGLLVTNSTSTTTATANRLTGNTVTSNHGNGISVVGSSFTILSSNVVGGLEAGEGNGGSGVCLGKNSAQSTLLSNSVIGNARHGIELLQSSKNAIGSSKILEGNIAAKNAFDGISISTGSTGNSILGNYLGVLADGITELGNTGDGIEINRSIGNKIQSNIIVANAGRGVVVESAVASSLALGNVVSSNTLRGNNVGISIFGSSGTTIGGSTTATANTISANFSTGIQVDGKSTNTLVSRNLVTKNVGNGVDIKDSRSTTVTSNTISTNSGVGIQLLSASGTSLIDGNTLLLNTVDSNELSGIVLTSSSFNTIGSVSKGNTITSNGSDGITINKASNGNDISSNRIGISVASKAAANMGNGIFIHSSFSNLVRSGNTISNNIGAGVWITNAAAPTLSTGNQILGNTISFNTADGVVVVGGGAHTIGAVSTIGQNTIISNGSSGVSLLLSTVANTLPGSTVAGNKISSNKGSGISLSGGGRHTLTSNTISSNNGDGIAVASSLSNTISSNSIGGASATLANTNGISLANGSTGNLISGNTINHNILDGITVFGARSVDNVIGTRVVGNGSIGTGNSISNNGGAGIRIAQGVRNQMGANALFANLGGGVVLAASANSNQPAPILTKVVRLSSGNVVQLQITGTVRGTPQQALVLQFFSNNSSDVSSGGFQSRTFLGTSTVTTNSLGIATFTLLLSANATVGQFITATSTTASGVIGNSSAISTLAVAVVAGSGIVPGVTTPLPSLPRAAPYRKW